MLEGTVSIHDAPIASVSDTRETTLTAIPIGISIAISIALIGDFAWLGISEFWHRRRSPFGRTFAGDPLPLAMIIGLAHLE